MLCGGGFGHFPIFLGFVGIFWGTPANYFSDFGAILTIFGTIFGLVFVLPFLTENPEPPPKKNKMCGCVAVWGIFYLDPPPPAGGGVPHIAKNPYTAAWSLKLGYNRALKVAGSGPTPPPDGGGGALHYCCADVRGQRRFFARVYKTGFLENKTSAKAEPRKTEAFLILGGGSISRCAAWCRSLTGRGPRNFQREGAPGRPVPRRGAPAPPSAHAPRVPDSKGKMY